MNKWLCLGLLCLLLACKAGVPDEQKMPGPVTNADFQLYPAPGAQALLVLFPGGGWTGPDTEREFPITAQAQSRGVSVAYMNFNLHFSLSPEEEEMLQEQIADAMAAHERPPKNLFIGGMSMGGIVAVGLGAHLQQSAPPALKPKGVFVVDSPIDLFGLYQSATHDLQQDLPEERLEEPRFIVDKLAGGMQHSDSIYKHLRSISPVTLSGNHFSNLSPLESVDLRFYTEPDTAWWSTERQTEFRFTNAYMLQHLTHLLKSNGWKQVELIQTRNKGFRSDGSRHPHSWSIVEQEELLDWVLR